MRRCALYRCETKVQAATAVYIETPHLGKIVRCYLRNNILAYSFP